MGDAILPELPCDTLGTYTLQIGGTLESIALQVYGDSSLWYLLADANGITEYKYHHDGRNGESGGLQLSNTHVIPKIRGIHNAIAKVFY